MPGRLRATARVTAVTTTSAPGPHWPSARSAVRRAHQLPRRVAEVWSRHEVLRTQLARTIPSPARSPSPGSAQVARNPAVEE